MKEIVLFDKFHIHFSEDDWEFMCKHRWFCDNPTLEEIEVEFGTCGIRDAKDDNEANRIVADTVQALREIIGLEIVFFFCKFLFDAKILHNP